MPLKIALPAPSPRQWRLGAAATAGAVLLLAALFGEPMLTSWLALAIAIPALALASLALSKAKTLEFCPEVLGGDVILPRAGSAEERPKLLLPLQFNNCGYADGIVEWIAVRFTLDGRVERSQLMTPVAEVDMQRFIQAKRRLEEHVDFKGQTTKYVYDESAAHGGRCPAPSSRVASSRSEPP